MGVICSCMPQLAAFTNNQMPRLRDYRVRYLSKLLPPRTSAHKHRQTLPVHAADCGYFESQSLKAIHPGARGGSVDTCDFLKENGVYEEMRGQWTQAHGPDFSSPVV